MRKKDFYTNPRTTTDNRTYKKYHTWYECLDICDYIYYGIKCKSHCQQCRNKSQRSWKHYRKTQYKKTSTILKVDVLSSLG